jgi:hypothetical protein
LRAEVHRLSRNVDVGFDLEVDGLLGNQQIGGVGRGELSVGGVNHAAAADEQKSVARGPGESQPVIPGIVRFHQDEIRERKLPRIPR